MSKKPPVEVVPVGPDETEVRQSAVIASTFANMELHTTKNTLQQYIQFYGAAKEENRRLATQLAEHERDSFSVVHFHRKELEKQTEALKNQQKQATEDLEKEKSKFNEERKALMATIAERDNQITDLNDNIGDLQADLDALSAFRRERNDLRLELSKFQDQAKADAESAKSEISRLRFESIEEKVRLKAEEKTLNKKFKADVSAHAMKEMPAKAKAIYSENFMLVQDKVLLEKELERVSQANTESDGKLSTLRRDHGLSKTNEDEYSKRNAKLNRANKQLNEKATELEHNLTQVVEQYELKLSEQTKRTGQQLSSMQEDRDDAHRTAAARHKELLRMRALTKQVVQQRSDLETFFNEALEFVRGQIAAERTSSLLIKTSGAVKKQQQPNQTTVGSGGGMPSIMPRRAQPPAGESSTKPGGGAGRKSAHHQVGGVPEFMQGNFEALPTTMDANAPHPGSAPMGGRGDHNATTTSAIAPSSSAMNPPTRGSVNTRNSSSASSLPPIPSAHGSRVNTAGMPGVTGAGDGGVDGKQVDISQLHWADKERVLRILFSKINQVRQDRHKAKQGASKIGLDSQFGNSTPNGGGLGLGMTTGGTGSAANSIVGGVEPMLIQENRASGAAGDETFVTTPYE